MALTPASVSEPFLYLFGAKKCDFLQVFAPRVFDIQEITLKEETKAQNIIACLLI